MGHLHHFLVVLLVCMLMHHITASARTSIGKKFRASKIGNSTSTTTTHSTPTPKPNTTHSTTPTTTHTTPTPKPNTTHSTTPTTTHTTPTPRPNTTHSTTPTTTPTPTPSTTHSTTPTTTPTTPTPTPNTTHSTTPTTTPTPTPSTTHSTTPTTTPTTPTPTPNTTHSTTPATTPTPTPSTTHSTTPTTTPTPTPTPTPNTTHSTTPTTTPTPTPSTTHSTTPTTTHTNPTPKPNTTHSTTPTTTHTTPTPRPNTTHSTTPTTTPTPTPSTTHSTTPTTTPTTPTPNTTHSTTPTTTHTTPTPKPNTTHSTTPTTTPTPTPSTTHSTTPTTTHTTPTPKPNTTHSTTHITTPTPTPNTTHSTTPTTTHTTPTPTPNTTHSTTPTTTHTTPTPTPNTTHSTIHTTPTPTPNTTHSTTPTTTHTTPTPTPNTTHSTTPTSNIPSSSPKVSPSKPESSPASKPTGTTPPTSPVTGKVTIMEVYYNLPQGHDQDDLPEFIELYGDRDLSLQGYTVVLFGGDTMTAFLIVSLDGYSLPHTNAAFVISTFNASFGPDLILTNKSLTGLNGQITMVTLYKNDSSSFTMDSTPSHDGLMDYVVYSSNTSEVPSLIRDWSSGFKAVVKDSRYPYESVSRCYSDEPENQRAFTLSFHTPGKENACDLRDDYPIINEIAHIEITQHERTCFIELQFSNNASQALNSFFLAIYSLATTAGHPIQNVTVDLWNERISATGYYLVTGITLDCQKTFVGGTVVVVLYQVPTDLKHFNQGFTAEDTYQYIKDGVAFNISSAPLDTGLAKIVLPSAQGFPRVSLHDEGPQFLSGSQSLSSCSRSIYNLTDPTPGGPNHCPLIPSVVPPVTTPTTHQTVKPNHVYINEVTYSAKNSEEYIEFKGDIQGDFSHYYIILFNTCTGDKIGGVPLNNTLDHKGFLQFNHTSTHTFSETLQHTGSIALGLYTHNVPTINVTQGLLDAVVMVISTKGNCSFLSLSLKYLTPNVLKPVALSKNDLDQGMTLSRCSGDLRNSSAFKVTELLTASTPGRENLCDSPTPRVVPPSKDKGSPNAVMITIAVVASCLVVFLLIFGVTVVIMKRKRRGVLQFRLDIMNDNDEEELITNHDPEPGDLISFNTDEDATFDNKTY